MSDVPTWVNGIDVIKTRLNRGDIVQVGGLRIRVVETGAPGARAEAAKPPAPPAPGPRRPVPAWAPLRESQPPSGGTARNKGQTGRVIGLPPP